MKKGGLITKLTIVAAFAVIALCAEPAQANTNSNEQLESMISTFLPEEFRNMNLTTDALEQALKEKCSKTSNVDVEALSKEVKEAVRNATIAFEPFNNVTAINEEIRIAKPTGELDTVFQSYCSKMPAFKSSLVKLNAKLLSCLDEEEKKQNAITLGVGSSLLDFACFKGGNQLALFIAEKGDECLKTYEKGIEACLNSSFASYIPKNASISNIFNLPVLLAATPDCDDLERFELCTLHYIKQCPNITPANVVESVFSFVNKEKKCKIHLMDELQTSSRNGASVTTASASFVVHAFVTLFTVVALRQRLV